MFVRIRRDQVRIGMYVENLEGTWTDHPFWTNRFLIADFEDVEKLKTSDVSAVLIDLAKGVGVAAVPPPAEPLAEAVPPLGDREAPVTGPVDMPRIERALGRSTREVRTLFAKARQGEPIDTGMAATLVGDIAEAVRRNPTLLVQITRLKTKDESTFVHSIAVCALMMQFARYLKLDEARMQALGLGGLLHDIGKIGLPSELLSKPDKLTEAEMRLVRTHPVDGHALLAAQPDLPPVVREICLNHHERIDGRGYPNGLKGEEIGPEVRMASICDVYDALTSVRSYRTSWSSLTAVTHMLERAGQFDRLLVLQFAACLGMRLSRETAPERRAAV